MKTTAIEECVKILVADIADEDMSDEDEVYALAAEARAELEAIRNQISETMNILDIGDNNRPVQARARYFVERVASLEAQLAAKDREER